MRKNVHAYGHIYYHLIYIQFIILYNINVYINVLFIINVSLIIQKKNIHNILQVKIMKSTYETFNQNK